MLDQFKILRVRSRDALDVNVWKFVAKLIGITYKSRMPKAILQTKPCTSPNSSRLITPKVPHEKFLRMSDYRASSNPRFALSFLFVFFFLQQYTTKQSCHSEQKIKKILFLGVSELTQTLVSADAYPRPNWCVDCVNFASAFLLSSGLYCTPNINFTNTSYLNAPMNTTKAVKSITLLPQCPMDGFKKLIQIGRQY